MKLAILGTGGHAKSVYDIIKKKKIYFFDKNKKTFKIGDKKFIVNNTSQLINIKNKKIFKVIVTIGDNKDREKNFNILKKNNFRLVTLIHPNRMLLMDHKLVRAVLFCMEVILIQIV